jgi:transcriptional regulator with XRE-family HTH domain
MQQHRGSPTVLATPEEAFAATLQRVRRRRGFSQEQLAFEAGFHPTYISQMERGKRNPSLRTILTLARVLKLPAYDLVRRVEKCLSKEWKRDGLAS